VNYGTCTTYSATATYALNALVIYNNRLYKCTTAITVAEAWNAAHWTAIADTNNGTVYNTTDSSFYGIRGADSVAKKLGSDLIAFSSNFSVPTSQYYSTVNFGIPTKGYKKFTINIASRAGGVSTLSITTNSGTVLLNTTGSGSYTFDITGVNYLTITAVWNSGTIYSHMSGTYSLAL